MMIHGRTSMLGKIRATRAFSLVEILVVVAIITVLSSLLLPTILGTRKTAHEQVARQQQAELQTALSNWIIAQSSGSGGLAAARAAYNETGGAKLQLLQNYLQAATYSSLSGSGDTVGSAALDSAGAYLQFSDWTSGGQPTVQWINR